MAEPRAPEDGLAALVDAFLGYAQLERGLANNTILAYSRDLARFADFLAGEGISRGSEVVPSHLAGFAHAMEREGLSARSRARALAAVRSLLRYGVRERVIEGDPIQSPRRPKFGAIIA